MKIGRFSLKNVNVCEDGINADLLYGGIVVDKISCDEDIETFYYNQGSWNEDAIKVSGKLIAMYPDGFDKEFYYNDVGDLGVTLSAAYAGDYGHISYLLKELIRLYMLEASFKNHPNSALLRVVYDNELDTHLVPLETLTEYIEKIEKRGGQIVFAANEMNDFVLLPETAVRRTPIRQMARRRIAHRAPRRAGKVGKVNRNF